jgi:hypothetical protein
MRKSLAALGFGCVLAACGGGAFAATVPAPPPAAKAAPAAAPAPQRTPEAVLVFYPAAARAAGVEGSAVLKCAHDEHLAVKGCVLVSETPAGQGFGAAALAMAAQASDNPKLNFADEPTRPAQEVEVRFTLHPPEIAPDITSMAHTIGQPAIITPPSTAQIQAAYPARALDNQIEGDAAMDCLITADGKLAGCRIASENPTGFGFGQAALDLGADYVMRPRYIDGEPSGGAQVRLGVRFRPSDPTAPLTLGIKPKP